MCFLNCLNNMYERLPALENDQRNSISPDSRKRVGLSLLPIIGTVMYVFNLHRAFMKYNRKVDTFNSEGSEEIYQKDFRRYSLFAANSILALGAMAVGAVSLGIISMIAAYAIGAVCLLSLGAITYLNFRVDYTIDLFRHFELDNDNFG